MSRAMIILHNDAKRRQAIEWAKKAPLGTRVEWKQPKRSSEQNDKMWAMLTEVAQQCEYDGAKRTPNEWKLIFMSALYADDMEYVTGLNGERVPLGFQSSDLGVKEMSDLIEFIYAYGMTKDIKFKSMEK